MTNDRSDEPTETDQRVAENRGGAPIAPLTRDQQDDVDPTTGLPRGMHDDDASPLDRGKPLDHFFGKAPSERVPELRPDTMMDQIAGTINEPGPATGNAADEPGSNE